MTERDWTRLSLYISPDDYKYPDTYAFDVINWFQINKSKWYLFSILPDRDTLIYYWWGTQCDPKGNTLIGKSHHIIDRPKDRYNGKPAKYKRVLPGKWHDDLYLLDHTKMTKEEIEEFKASCVSKETTK